MSPTESETTLPSFVACLGPEGSFSHLLTEQCFSSITIRALASIGEVFDLLATQPNGLGIVPIENSSGGFVVDTVDRLVDVRSPLRIQEELTLNVRLALLGHLEQSVAVIYSHPMPFFHADEWLRRHHPEARRVSMPSTAAAAERAAKEPAAATIGSLRNAERHGLDVLHFPISGEVPNLTQFFLIGHQEATPSPEHNRTALVVELADRPGSLCLFLTPLSQAGINMKRLESRPIRGQPNQYRFYIEIEGSSAQPRVASALEQASAAGATIRSLGSYRSGRVFES